MSPLKDVGGTNVGNVYVFDRVSVGSTFNQVGILSAGSNVTTTDYFGFSVATSADGKTIIVGAPNAGTSSDGMIYMFNRSGDTFTQVDSYDPTGLTYSNAYNTFSTRSGFDFGNKVAISSDGSMIVASALDSDRFRGQVFVFKENNNKLQPIKRLPLINEASSRGFFGSGIAIDRNKNLLIGAPSYVYNYGDVSGPGKVFVYDLISENNLFVPETGGYVGIATSMPKQQLDVNGSYGQSGNIMRGFLTYAIVQDIKNSAEGQTFTANRWNKRDLNTVICDPDNIIAGLSGTSFNLYPGSYLIKWSAEAYDTDRHKTQLRLISGAGTTLAYYDGTSAFSNATYPNQTTSYGSARVLVGITSNPLSLGETQTIELHHFARGGRGGVACQTFTGFYDTYATVEIYKELE